MAREDWKLLTGLPDDFDGEITDAVFGFNQNYMSGSVPLLMLTLESDELDEPQTIQLSFGSDWEVKDRGRRIVRTNGKKPGINKNSSYGHFIERIRQLSDDFSADWVKPLVDRSPFEADVWVGMKFHWAQEEFKTPGGETKTRLMPVQYLGEAKKGKSAKSAMSVAKSDDDDSLTKKLKELAKKHDQKAFAKKAMSLEGVMDDDDLVNQILSGEFWSSVHAEDED